MRSRKAGSTTAAVLLTAAVVLTAGCSGGGGDGDGGDTDAKKRPSGTASSPAAGEGGEQGPPAPNKDVKGDEGAKVPKVPTDELSPATGTFTKKQKKYLVDRVPKGTDPAAILEAGTAACARIGTVAEADRKAVISALKSGEIANAEAAVEHLCPKYEPLLEAAGLK